MSTGELYCRHGMVLSQCARGCTGPARSALDIEEATTYIGYGYLPDNFPPDDDPLPGRDDLVEPNPAAWGHEPEQSVEDAAAEVRHLVDLLIRQHRRFAVECFIAGLLVGGIGAWWLGEMGML